MGARGDNCSSLDECQEAVLSPSKEFLPFEDPSKPVPSEALKGLTLVGKKCSGLLSNEALKTALGITTFGFLEVPIDEHSTKEWKGPRRSLQSVPGAAGAGCALSRCR